LPGDGLRSPSERRGAFRREPLPCGVAGVSVLVRVHALSPSFWCSHAHDSRSAPESGPERWYRSLDRRGVCLLRFRGTDLPSCESRRSQKALARATSSSSAALRRRDTLHSCLARESGFDGREAGHEFLAERAGVADVAGDDLRRALTPPLLQHGRELLEDPIEQALELLDVTADEQELPLDLLDGVALGHHLLDAQDLAEHAHRVHPLGATVLALPSDAHAARQEPELDVLAERRLAERDPVLREHVEDLRRSEAVRVRALDSSEGGGVNHGGSRRVSGRRAGCRTVRGTRQYIPLNGSPQALRARNLRNFWASSIDAAARSRYDIQCPIVRAGVLAMDVVVASRRSTRLVTRSANAARDQHGRCDGRAGHPWYEPRGRCFGLPTAPSMSTLSDA